MSKYQTYLFVGAPGSGKGTHGKALGKIPGFFHCACGDVFRALDLRTPLGQEFLAYSSRGELVPDELTVSLWKARINQSVESHLFHPDHDFLLLDGIPRNVHQAQMLDDKIRPRKVFHLSCPDRSMLFERLRRRALKDNRFDDASDKVIQHRLDTYEQESKPLLDYYGDDVVCRIDASRPPAEVMLEILGIVVKDRRTQPVAEGFSPL